MSGFNMKISSGPAGQPSKTSSSKSKPSIEEKIATELFSKWKTSWRKASWNRKPEDINMSLVISTAQSLPSVDKKNFLKLLSSSMSSKDKETITENVQNLFKEKITQFEEAGAKRESDYIAELNVQIDKALESKYLSEEARRKLNNLKEDLNTGGLDFGRENQNPNFERAIEYIVQKGKQQFLAAQGPNPFLDKPSPSLNTPGPAPSENTTSSPETPSQSPETSSQFPETPSQSTEKPSPEGG